ncbi:hypothetical protein, partial [Pectobacterium brasiliense]|uniref:hypothetical protein n=1 Tax=Pectobacterium brasiliense TaxID=180957 RepID=UPI001CA47B85
MGKTEIRIGENYLSCLVLRVVVKAVLFLRLSVCAKARILFTSKYGASGRIRTSDRSVRSR